MIRFAAKHMQWRVGPGPHAARASLLQRLTTREPTLDQVEVAIASLRAVLTAEQLVEVERRSTTLADAAAASGPRDRLTCHRPLRCLT